MSSAKRPRKFGYRLGAALIVVGAAVAAAFAVIFIVQITGKLPINDHSFGSNQSTTLQINAGESKSVYYTNTPAPSSPSIHCDVRGDPGKHTPHLTSNDFHFIPTASWRAKYSFKAD